MPETGHAASRGLSLLGGWQLVVGGETVAFGGREQRLCALLALTGTRARAQVAGTLWPESTHVRALASLRQAVAQTHQRSPGLLATDRTSVGLAPDVAVDVHVLREAVLRAGSPDADATLLAALVGEELLPGWYDEWAEAERESLRQQRVAALERLSRRALDRGDTVLAEDAARAVARIDPLRELEPYREVLREELGVVPAPALLPAVPPEPPPGSDPPSPRWPADLSARAAAARLMVGAAVGMAASLAFANLGPDSGRSPPYTADGSPEQPTATDDQGTATRQVQVRLVAAAGGAAAFVVRATQRPARVRLELAGPSGDSVVRSVVVRSRDGQWLVLDGLDGGTYRWSATSPTAAPATGEVRVDEQAPPVVLAAEEPSQDPTPTTSAPTTPAPAPTPLLTPTPSPTPTPIVTPSHHPSPTPQPSPPRHTNPSSQPTDPGTQDPGLVG